MCAECDSVASCETELFIGSKVICRGGNDLPGEVPAIEADLSRVAPFLAGESSLLSIETGFDDGTADVACVDNVLLRVGAVSQLDPEVRAAEEAVPTADCLRERLPLFDLAFGPMPTTSDRVAR